MNISTADDADIRLLPGRAAVVTASQTLLVADLHLGKAAAFRRAGIPVPEGSAQHDLARLERLVAEQFVKRLVVLGDLFHAKGGCTDRVFEEFREFRRRIAGIECLLVLGNHDHGVGRIPPDLGLDACLPVLDEPPFHFVHEPGTPLPEPGRDQPFTIAGHVHPVIALASPSGDRLTDRCFVADPGLLVMPAFGSFTGGHRVTAMERSRVWIARDDGVVDVTRIVQLAR